MRAKVWDDSNTEVAVFNRHTDFNFIPLWMQICFANLIHNFLSMYVSIYSFPSETSSTSIAYPGCMTQKYKLEKIIFCAEWHA